MIETNISRVASNAFFNSTGLLWTTGKYELHFVCTQFLNKYTNLFGKPWKNIQGLCLRGALHQSSATIQLITFPSFQRMASTTKKTSLKTRLVFCIENRFLLHFFHMQRLMDALAHNSNLKSATRIASVLSRTSIWSHRQANELLFVGRVQTQFSNYWKWGLSL